MKKLTYNLHRIFAALLLVAILFFGADYYLDLGFFSSRASKGALIATMAVVVIYGAFFSATREDMREHRDASKIKKND